MRQRRSYQRWQPRYISMLFVIGSTTLVAIATVDFSYQFLRQLILDNLKHNVSLQVQDGVGKIDNWLNTRKAEIVTIANTPTVRTMDWSVARPYLQSEAARLKDFYFLAMTNPDGIRYNTSAGRVEGNVKDRRHFQQAMAGNVYVGEPVISRTFGAATVPITAPVWSNLPAAREPIGVIAAPITTERVVEVVSRLKYGSGSYSFALSSEGVPIAHPDANAIGTREQPTSSFLQAKDPALRHIAARMVERQSGIELVQMNGVWVYVAYSPLSQADWSLALVIPRENIESHLKPLNLLTAVGGGLLAIATIAALRLVIISERSRARAEREALLNRLTKQIRESLELEQILQITVEEVCTLLQLERVAFGSYDAHQNTLQIQCESCCQGLGLIWQGRQFGVEPDFAARAQFTQSVQLQPVNSNSQSQPMKLKAQHYLAFPVRTESELLGYLILVRASRWFNRPGEKELLQAVADQLAIAITQSHLYRQTKEQVQQLALALDKAALVVITDANGIITQVNDIFCQLSQYSREELIGQHYSMLKRGDRELAPTERSTHACDRVWKGEINNPAKDGTNYWLDTTIVPFFDANGTLSEYLIVAFDITQRKRAEEALHQSEIRFRTAVDNIPDTFVIYNKHRQFQFVNAEGIRRTGKSLQEIFGRTDEEIWSSEVASQYLPLLQRAVETRTIQTGECDLTLPTFGSFTVIVTYVPLFDERGEISQILGITHDITDRKRAEFALHQLNRELERRVRERTAELQQANERLQAEIRVREQAQADLWESQQQLQGILDNSPAFIFVIDRQNRHLLSNRSYEGLLHTTNEQLVGKSIYEVWSAEFANAFATINKQVLERGISIETEEIAPFGGEIHTYLVNKFPLFDANGVPYAVCGISTDITERKKAQAKLERLTIELQRSNRDLEQFAAVASHDLQEPLRAVRGFTQLLMEYSNQLDESGQEYLNYVFDGAVRMQQLIHDLLAYSRLSSRSSKFALTDCNTVLLKAIANLRVAIQESQATITCDSLPMVSADKTQLLQLFQNLISNAIKFHREEPPQVRIWAELREGEWLFGVRDNGIGVESSYIEQIFEVFKRLHSRREFSGTGIGLAICKKIVECHGGRIWAESQPGQGTTFFFTIPISPQLHSTRD